MRRSMKGQYPLASCMSGCTACWSVLEGVLPKHPAAMTVGIDEQWRTRGHHHSAAVRYVIQGFKVGPLTAGRPLPVCLVPVASWVVSECFHSARTAAAEPPSRWDSVKHSQVLMHIFLAIHGARSCCMRLRPVIATTISLTHCLHAAASSLAEQM